MSEEEKKEIHEPKNKQEHDQLIDEWPGLTVVDYFTPSWRPFRHMDRMFGDMAREMNEQVRFIRANLDHDDFEEMREEIPAQPHYRFFKKNK